MKIYGFYAGSHDPTIVYLEDGEIKFAIQEERLKRIKSADDFPQNPILTKNKIEELTGLKLEEADFITTSTPIGYDFILSQNLPNIGIRSYDHHECHAKAAYFTSGFSGKSITITLDGGGDGTFGSIWLCEDGNMKLIKEINIGDSSSFGKLWMTATDYFGWKSLKDEGKIMGMAGNGNFNQKIYDSLKKIITYKKGSLSFGPPSSTVMSNVFFQNLQKYELLNDKQFRFDVAYNLQKVTEEVMLEFIEDLIDLYPSWSKRFCFAGGIFANVKMNQKINEINSIEEIWVLPPMGDEGLALGSAICLSNQLGEWTKPKRLDNVFFGLNYSEEEILHESLKYDFRYIDYNPEIVADFLIDGLIGAFFKGRFEYGPRSLGARSIIVQATNPKTHDILNERLERNEVMPFAPAVLSDRSEEIFYYADKSKYSAEFMTICYTVKEKWIDKIPACIHSVDNTGRPQFVNKKTNKYWYELINAYYIKTGIPVILNTSFNGHGEPIIDNPSQSFKHLERGTIDFLIMENKIFLKK